MTPVSGDRLSFGCFIGDMGRLFPDALLSGDGFDRLLEVADRLPLCVIDRTFGFEFPLSTEAATADLFVVVEPASSLAAHYVRLGDGAHAGSAAAALGACLDRAASDPASLLARRDGGIILEYDIPAQGRKELPPGIFFAARDLSIAGARKFHNDPEETVTSLWAAAGLCADRAELRQVKRVHEALSNDALVFQAGVLPSRPQRAVRLVVHFFDTDELTGLLDRLNWPGSINIVLSVIAATRTLTSPGAVLSLDVSANGMSSRLGLELPRSGRPASIGGGDWHPMIELLTDRQWCLPAKSDGLRAWTGVQGVLGPLGVFRVHQYINHFKVVVDRGDTVAKAYAGMVVRRFNE